MKVVLVGASFVEAGSPLVVALEVQLSAELGEPVEVVGLGVRGARLPRWLAEARRNRDELASSTLIGVVELGGNGVPGPNEVRAAHNELEEMGPVVWVDPPVWPSGTIRTAREATHEAIVDAGVPRVRTRRVVSSSDLAPDGAHLTRTGYRRFAEAIAPAMARRLKGGFGIVAAVLGVIGVAALGWAIWGNA